MKCNNSKSQAVHLMADCSVLHPLLFLELPGPGSKTISDLSGTVNSLLSLSPPCYPPCSSPCPCSLVSLLVLCASLISDLRRHCVSLLFFSSLLSNHLKNLFYLYLSLPLSLYLYLSLSLSISISLSLSISISLSLSISISLHLSLSLSLSPSLSLHFSPL